MARIAAPRTVGTIVADGPFFDRDPTRTLDENVRDFLDRFAEEGERDLVARISSIPPRGVRTGQTRAKVRGRTRAHSGKRWKRTAVIGIPNVGMTETEAISTYAAMAGIERRYHPVRDMASALNSATAISSADLTRGMGG